MSNRQHHKAFDDANGPPSSLPFFDPVLFKESVWVSEDASGHLKADAMLVQIDLSFAGVPLKACFYKGMLLQNCS